MFSRLRSVALRSVALRTVGLVALVTSGCGDDPVRILGGACALSDEQRLAISVGPVVHDVALAADGDGAWAAWSDRSGAFARALDAVGVPRGDTIRIGAPCEGGLAAVARDGELLLACGRRGEDARGDAGGVQVLAVRERAVTIRGAIGALGPDGDGVALAMGETGELVVGWQEARDASSAAWMARLDASSAPERLSSPRFRASRPSLAFREGVLVATWSETWLTPRGGPEGRVQLRIGSRASRGVAEIAYGESYPVVRATGEPGGLVLSFRDRRPATARPRVFVARVASEGVELGRVERSLHANAAGESLTIGCAADTFVIAPRTHTRTERLVGVRRHSGELEPLGPEQQIYEHGAVFDHADAQCVAGRPLVLFASRPSRRHDEGSVRALSIDCAAVPE